MKLQLPISSESSSISSCGTSAHVWQEDEQEDDRTKQQSSFMATINKWRYLTRWCMPPYPFDMYMTYQMWQLDHLCKRWEYHKNHPRRSRAAWIIKRSEAPLCCRNIRPPSQRQTCGAQASDWLCANYQNNLPGIICSRILNSSCRIKDRVSCLLHWNPNDSTIMPPPV